MDLLKKYILPKEVNWLIYGEKAINPALFKNILNFSGVDSNLKKLFLKYIEESDEIILRKILKFSTGNYIQIYSNIFIYIYIYIFIYIHIFIYIYFKQIK